MMEAERICKVCGERMVVEHGHAKVHKACVTEWTRRQRSKQKAARRARIRAQQERAPP